MLPGLSRTSPAPLYDLHGAQHRGRRGRCCAPARRSGPVRDAFRACHARAVGAAVKRAVSLDAVSDHLDVAVLADGCERVDRALEAVEGVRVSTGHAYLKSLIVLIPTDLALGHIHLLLPGTGQVPISKKDTLATVQTNPRSSDPEYATLLHCPEAAHAAAKAALMGVWRRVRDEREQ